MYLQPPELQEAPLATCRGSPNLTYSGGEGSERREALAWGSSQSGSHSEHNVSTPDAACIVRHEQVSAPERGGRHQSRGMRSVTGPPGLAASCYIDRSCPRPTERQRDGSTARISADRTPERRCLQLLPASVK